MSSIQETIIRRVKHMCSHCYTLLEGDMIVEFRSVVRNYPSDIDKGIVIDPIAIGVCPYCGHDGEFVCIDFKLAETISLLNKKGYRTKYSCEGHGKRLEPYIYFSAFQFTDNFNTLPSSWYVDYNPVFQDGDIIRSNLIQYPNCNTDIYNWACRLPSKEMEEIDKSHINLIYKMI